MKKTLSKNYIFLILVSILLFAFGINFFAFPNLKAYAEEGTTLPVLSNGKFTLTPSIYSRTGETLSFTTRTITNNVGEEITYYVYNWRDVSHLSFVFNTNLQDETDQYVAYEFTASTIQTENFETDIGQMTTSTLTSGTISNNTVNIPIFYYYFDQNAVIDLSPNKRSGNDFGLYKFDFIYTKMSDGSSHKIALPNSLYIAILPDDVDTISTEGLSLSYIVSSSTRLMSVYNMSLSDQDAFKYINPNYIEWSVVGKDKNNVNYVLSQKVKDSKIEYANYKIIWTSQLPSEPIGPTFRFDSNNIEGTWIVSCTIFNSAREEKTTISSTELSTIKAPEPAYWWIAILFASLAIAGGIVALIVYKNKNKNKS